MTVFLSTLSQMAYLLLLIAAGYLLCRFGAVTPGAAGVLSKLENCLFIPALCIGTFMTNFTPEKFAKYVRIPYDPADVPSAQVAWDQ